MLNIIALQFVITRHLWYNLMIVSLRFYPLTLYIDNLYHYCIVYTANVIYYKTYIVNITLVMLTT